jgi:hypothetical protein
MALKTSAMSDSRMSQITPSHPPMIRKLVILFALVIDAALGLIFLFQQYPDSPFVGRMLLSNLGLGLVAGLSARFTMRGRHWFVRFIAAAASLIVGLLVIGLFTNREIGLGPLEFWRKDVDWFGLSQLGIGIVPALLVLGAWTRSAAVTSSPSHTPPPPPIAALPPSEPPRKPSVKPDRKKSLRSRPATTPVRNRPRGKAVSGEPALAIKVPAKPKWRAFRHKPQMHFSKQEKSLCPYCLEPVVPNDPRGVVECKICHALHHADCWEITGTCQVPHYNA